MERFLFALRGPGAAGGRGRCAAAHGSPSAQGCARSPVLLLHPMGGWNCLRGETEALGWVGWVAVRPPALGPPRDCRRWGKTQALCLTGNAGETRTRYGHGSGRVARPVRPHRRGETVIERGAHTPVPGEDDPSPAQIKRLPAAASPHRLFAPLPGTRHPSPVQPPPSGWGQSLSGAEHPQPCRCHPSTTQPLPFPDAPSPSPGAAPPSSPGAAPPLPPDGRHPLPQRRHTPR